MEKIRVESRGRDDWIDITGKIRDVVRKDGARSGVVTVYVPHTTAGVTIQENADPPLKHDITATLDRLFPWDGGYRHGEDNAAAHMKTMFAGSSAQIIIDQGELVLGTWQSIYLLEFDGPRRREVVIHIS